MAKETRQIGIKQPEKALSRVVFKGII
jgi:hypothetical protein